LAAGPRQHCQVDRFEQIADPGLVDYRINIGDRMSAKRDQLAIIRIEGMHSHQCEQQIQRALSALPGVHEVEVDFSSAQVSVLYSKSDIEAENLMDAIRQAGYKATSLLQSRPSRAKSNS
jgi:copper chaperone CopZ